MALGTPALVNAPPTLVLSRLIRIAPSTAETEAGAEVPDRLGDPGDLAVVGAGGPVDGVGAGRARASGRPRRRRSGSTISGRSERQVGELVGQQVEARRSPSRCRARRPGARRGGRGCARRPGPDHEADEEIQQVHAGFGGGLGERHLGVHAGEEEVRDEHERHQQPSTALSTAKSRSRKICSRSSGSATRSSQSTKATIVSDADDQARPGRGAAPAPHARLLQAEHDQAHRASDQHRAAVVDLRRALLVVRFGDAGSGPAR